ncbi:hypothetical protein ACH427_27795 [Streptomyces sp. NPDC020379]|uniref:terpene synthase family protein n=1 Tax=Streptomyces sp. NPDC020379 TaxID=3365071 RepID=UPI0037B45AFB
MMPLSSLSSFALGPEKVNKHAREAEQISEEHCRRLGILLPHFTEYVTISSWLYPHATPDRLSIVNVVNALAFYIDDAYVETPLGQRSPQDGSDDPLLRQALQNGISCLRGEPPAPTASAYRTLPVAYRQVRELLCTGAPESWIQRLADSLLTHHMSSCMLRRTNCSAADLSLKYYLKVRPEDSGMYFTTDLMEFANENYVPDNLWRDQGLFRMRQITATFGAVLNDLFSYHKEARSDGNVPNIVNVLATREGLSFELAVHRTTDILNNLVAEFRQLLSGAGRCTGPVPDAYARGLHDELTACYHWQMSTNRYRSPDSPFPELREYIR